MSDEQGQPPGEEHAPNEAAALGSWLREARAAAGLGIEALAAALHLDPDIVAALEGEAFETLGAPVFVRGHIRALAGELGLDPAEAIRRYEATAGESGLRPPDLVVQYQRPIRRKRLGPALLVAVIAILTIVLVSLFLLWPDADSRPPMPAGDPGASAGVRDAAAPIGTDAPAQAPPEPASRSAVPASAAEDSDFAARLAAARARTAADTAPTGSETTRAAAPASDRPAAAPAGLTLSFSGECWYEVRDADGRRLATGTAAPGETRSLDGLRPLSVTLGVADAVTLTLDGARVEIPPESRRGRSARLTLR